MDQLERGRGLIQIRKWALKEEREDIEQKQSKVDKIVKFDCLQKKKRKGKKGNERRKLDKGHFFVGRRRHSWGVWNVRGPYYPKVSLF